MIKDRIYKLIVIGMLIIFGVGLFLSIRFLRAEINSATHPITEINQLSSGFLNTDAWQKIKHRFE